MIGKVIWGKGRWFSTPKDFDRILKDGTDAEVRLYAALVRLCNGKTHTVTVENVELMRLSKLNKNNLREARSSLHEEWGALEYKPVDGRREHYEYRVLKLPSTKPASETETLAASDVVLVPVPRDVVETVYMGRELSGKIGPLG